MFLIDFIKQSDRKVDNFDGNSFRNLCYSFRKHFSGIFYIWSILLCENNIKAKTKHLYFWKVYYHIGERFKIDTIWIRVSKYYKNCTYKVIQTFRDWGCQVGFTGWPLKSLGLWQERTKQKGGRGQGFHMESSLSSNTKKGDVLRSGETACLKRHIVRHGLKVRVGTSYQL